MKARIEFIWALAFSVLFAGTVIAAEWGGVGPIASGGAATFPVSGSPYGSASMIADAVFCVENEADTVGACLAPISTNTLRVQNKGNTAIGVLQAAEIIAFDSAAFVSGLVYTRLAADVGLADGSDIYWTDHANYGNSGTVTHGIYHGTGAPTANYGIGSVYNRTDGGSGVPTHYVSTTGLAAGMVPIMTGDLYATGAQVHTSADTTVSIAVADTYYQVTDALIDEDAGATHHWTTSDGIMTPATGTNFGLYQVSANLCFSAGNGNTVKFALYANGTSYPLTCGLTRTMSTTSVGCAPIICRVPITTTGAVSLYVKNVGATTDVVIAAGTTFKVTR